MKGLALSFFAFASLYAQSSDATFEVATIKPSPPNDGGFTRGCKGGPGTGDPVLWRCTNATISMLVVRAYGIKQYQLTAPDWTFHESYEISARLAPDTTKEQFREMIRNLLTDRFKLEFHWSKKEINMYDLVVAKSGSKLKESVDQPADDGKKLPDKDADGYPNIRKDCSGCMAISAGKARYWATKELVKNFAEMLGNQLGLPVTDQTGLPARYDITLSWGSGGGVDRHADADAAADPSVAIETAVQEQLGLRLVPKKGLIDVIVFDKAERIPAGN